MATAKLCRPLRREIGETGLVVQLTPEGVYMREKGEHGWLGPYAYGSLFLRCAEISAGVRRLELRPGVAREEYLDLPQRQAKHHGVVVADRAALPVGHRRMEHLEPGIPDIEHVTGPQHPP